MVVPAKRVVTYSRKNMTVASEEHSSSGQPVEGRKRRKTDSPQSDDAQPMISPGLSEGSERPRPKSTAKKFSGPVSITTESEVEGDVDGYGMEYIMKTKEATIRKKAAALNKHLEMLATSKQADHANRSLEKLSNVYHRKIADNNNLDRQRTGDVGLDEHKSEKEGDTVAHKLAKNPSRSLAEERCEMMEVYAQTDKAKIPDIPNQYLASPTSAPLKDLFRKRFPKESKEVKLWSYNQSSSPLLRLPGEIRNRIFDLALGGNTICIEYNTYRQEYKSGRKKVVAHFKYHCQVFDSDRINPWAQFRVKKAKSTQGFTLLNHVCRQLYQETCILPYRLNRWAFFNHLTMWNFLADDERLSRQQRNAIREIVVRDHVPQPNLLELLGGLQRVLLAEPSKGEDAMQKGWYKVEESPRGAELVRDTNYTPLK